MSVYARRRIANAAVTGLSVAATGFGLLWLVLVLWTLLVEGVSAIAPSLFTQMTPPPGSAGGLLNAIFGSLAMTVIATLIGTPTGILAGTFLAEYSRGSRFGEIVRFINDILLSAPSIIVGLFVYQLLVVPMGHFSAWAGSVALAIIVIPVVVRTTEDMLNLVPNALREAAAALGSPRWKVIVMVAYRAAIQGMVTGVLLAVARIAGETAPLLFTALNNQFWSTDLNAPMANLPVVIFQFAMSPYADWQVLAWGGALLITVAVLFLNIGARLIAARGALESMSPALAAPIAADASPAVAAERQKVSIRGLDFFYNDYQALKRISVPLYDRRVTAFIGPSGCGKSTLLRVLNRIYELYPGQRATGEVLVDGENILDPGRDLNLLRAKIGMVFQRPTPFPMSIRDNIAFGIRLYERLPRAELDDRIEAALRRAALWDEVRDKLKQSGLGLSGGQQQRLCIARAIAVQPEILLLDEPASALDPISTQHIEELIAALKSDYCIAIVTHNMQQAARTSDYTAFMYLGELVEFDATETIFTHPKERRTEDYITGRFG